MSNYPAPLDQLLQLGDPRGQRQWLNYPDLGIGPEHIPDLIRMVLDEDLRWSDSESKEVWANLHAWRALGQLRAEAAIEPLVGILKWIDEDQDDWVDGDVPEVLGLIGPAALPALTLYVENRGHGLYARAAAANGIAKIAAHHPEAREQSLAVLARQLLRPPRHEDEYELNGFIVGDLIDVEAVEVAPAIERAFAAGRVEEYVQGDWEDVQVALGLKAHRTAPENYRPRTPFGQMLESLSLTAKRRTSSEVLAGHTEASKSPTGAAEPKRKRHRRKKKNP
jgi:hypothetical protein